MSNFKLFPSDCMIWMNEWCYVCHFWNTQLCQDAKRLIIFENFDIYLKLWDIWEMLNLKKNIVPPTDLSGRISGARRAGTQFRRIYVNFNLPNGYFRPLVSAWPKSHWIQVWTQTFRPYLWKQTRSDFYIRNISPYNHLKHAYKCRRPVFHGGHVNAKFMFSADWELTWSFKGEDKHLFYQIN